MKVENSEGMSKHGIKLTVILGLLPVLMGSAACAGSAGSPLGKHNNKAPIEVTSDSLEVQQQQNRAVFTGHVVAIQGDVRLTSDKMTVFYAGGEAKKADKKKPDNKADKRKTGASK